MRNVTKGESVTLSCEIYGYLSSSPDITWTLNPDIVLSNDSTYTITTRDGNRLIQNGELFPSPSFISDLTFTHNTSQLIQIYTCAFLTTRKMFTLTLTHMITPGQTETGKSISSYWSSQQQKRQVLQYKDLQTEGVSFLYGYSIAKLQSGIQYQVYSIIDSLLNALQM